MQYSLHPLISELQNSNNTMKTPIYMIIHILLPFLASLSAVGSASPPQQLLKGFATTPDPTVQHFQPFLSDPTGNFSLSFLRVNQGQLALAIVHVASGVPFWRASVSFVEWGEHTQLTFNGSLVIIDRISGVFWSTNTDGDRVVLSSDPNLQILKSQRQPPNNSLWQSFDFPSDTLVESQNFSSAMRLQSSNGLYTMRLGSDFIGLYAKFKPEGSDEVQIYYKHRAWQAKVRIVEGHGPVLARISPDGFLGMYQNGSIPADVQPFNSYQRTVPEPRRVVIEADGNLKGYYWAVSRWALDYQLISKPCELPSPCGRYGLCTDGEGCSCLDNRTIGECYPEQTGPGDLCHQGKGSHFNVLRRTGVELPFKDLMTWTQTTSYEECEKSCHVNCTCWGAVYNNASGRCYTVDYPIQTIIGIGDESKMGYFKLWEGTGKRVDRRLGIGIGLLCGAIFVLLSVLGVGCYRLRRRKSKVNNKLIEENEIVGSGPYKDLSSDFRSIELSCR